MLLYDEINRKGFEGDLVVNGFASFLRNLLVCKDEKAARLLDVVEGMQAKFIEQAKKVSTAFIVSALNILNETEINYKMARNKRLHVELAIIKLNFLQQAIELASDNGAVVKKKRLDGLVAYKKKLLQPMQVKAAEAKLKIDKEELGVRSQGPRVREPEVYKSTTSYQPPSKKGLLAGLRERYGSEYIIEEIREPEPLVFAKLQLHINEYAKKLEAEQKHSSANTFKSARLRLVDELKFEITVDAITQQKFVEQEKTMLNDHIQKAFNNRQISFDIVVKEGEAQEIPLRMKLNSRERFERITEQYPLLKELKDRLKLDIDYL
jgi:DNA polymerase-3 subunit gamma/tau